MKHVVTVGGVILVGISLVNYVTFPHFIPLGLSTLLGLVGLILFLVGRIYMAITPTERTRGDGSSSPSSGEMSAREIYGMQGKDEEGKPLDR